MIISSCLTLYLRTFSPTIPLWHWIVIVAVSVGLALIIKSRKGISAYGTVTLAFVVLLGLFLLDALALIRMGDRWAPNPGLDLVAELQQITSGNEENSYLMIFNTAVFVPFGLFLSEFFISIGIGKLRSFGKVAVVAFGLSLLIECLQFFFHIGIFELTDLLLNTFGALIGASISLGGHSLLRLVKIKQPNRNDGLKITNKK